MTDPHKPVGNLPPNSETPIPRAASDARESASGADAAMSVSRGFEGTHKQTADTNVEEQLAGQTGGQGASDRFFGDLNRLNAKRTYDLTEIEQLMTLTGDLAHHKRVQFFAEQQMADSLANARRANNNAVTTDKVGDDRLWNVDEQGYQVDQILENQSFRDDIRAVIVDVLAGMSKK